VDGEQEVQAKLEEWPQALYHLLPWGTSEQTARTFFEQAHGCQPESVKQTGGGTLVGPVPMTGEHR
jgi:hypothetical protein